MSSVSDPRPAVSPLLTAALLLCALSLLRALRLPCPTVEQILDATGAKRTRAYALKDKLLGLLPTLERPVGRPRAEPPPARADTAALTGQILGFIMRHPGCARHGGRRRHYSEAFRRFILELAQRHPQIPHEAFAVAVQVPLGTLKDWLRGGEGTEAPRPKSTAASTDPVATGRVETLVVEYRRWQGTFSAFCDHVQKNLRVPFGRTLIASILEQHGLRTPRRRSGRSPDEKALRGAFETFFPGAQWQGDGSPVVVQVGQQRFRFNIELMVDARSDAVVGASVRDEEDAQAVTEAFDDGVQTTGAPPLATLLDNRPSNHTDQVEQGLAPSMTMYATKARPQNKAHVEGAFGLFFQVVPLLSITATVPRELAHQLLKLVVQTWGRTLNHKPTKNRDGRSRADNYANETPTPEQIEQARAALQQRIKQQDKARQTLQARQDPAVRDILDQAFARLGLLDPKGNIRAAIARYPLDHVVNGIATFEGRLKAGSLPEGVDARFLLGIVRNISQQDEGLHISEALLRLRLDAQDRMLAALRQTRDALLILASDPIETIKSMTDHAIKADRQIDRLFWLGAVADHIRRQHCARHTALLRFASRRIHASFAVPYRDRQEYVRFICSRVIPLA
jgi:hypothetical protein